MTKIRKIILQIPFSVIIYLSLRKLKNIPWFIFDYFKFKKLSRGIFSIKVHDFFPALLDKTSKTSFEPHYIYHPAWAARIVKEINPKYHTDISSTLTFVSIISAFIPVKFYDYRPAMLNLSNLESRSADLTNLPFADGSIDSLSCMHVVEHIGLGRYGDPIDPEGDLKAIMELKRVVAPGGSLLFVVPVGRPKIAFNAHRIYSYEQIIQNFSEFDLKDFSLIGDDFKETGIINNSNPDLVKDQDWGCGCFWFIKK
ncbi:MAG: hypothetical protein CO137_02830 [Candidatus Magasanikbacteria bacterium CG_4_9_14_3_um_filter_32_9]|uniref:DUF268 domain-containing protein n=1 Tax=Candidatus Magasanikbacteria bacterium CG_4_9_14_3_um_filter_32_9 TaxID=1974644 RepID=A0A2M7Z6D0_9BACT|nr:MAG: hypothetical protein CO137_02830 [Candidatus Magasanikbacteria bacterium CG_4_9_14_3_um_filter_32_9]